MPIAIGLFGVSEILITLEQARAEAPKAPRCASSCRARRSCSEARPPIGRGSLIGFLFGIVPGITHIVSTFVSYAIEKRLSRTPEGSATAPSRASPAPRPPTTPPPAPR